MPISLALSEEMFFVGSIIGSIGHLLDEKSPAFILQVAGDFVCFNFTQGFTKSDQ